MNGCVRELAFSFPVFHKVQTGLCFGLNFVGVVEKEREWVGV